MIRSELVRNIAEKNPSLGARDVERLVGVVFEAISARLADGGRVELRGFGAFSTRGRDARTGRNPRTGETVQRAASKAVKFRPGEGLKSAVQ